MCRLGKATFNMGIAMAGYKMEMDMSKEKFKSEFFDHYTFYTTRDNVTVIQLIKANLCFSYLP